MKTSKSGIFILTVLFAALMAGCGSSSPATTTDTTVSATTTTSGTTADAAWTPDGVITDGEYDGSFKNGDYELYWSSDADTVYFGMRARTGGWVAVGFPPGRTMQDADIVIGYVDGGNAIVSDEFSTGIFGPHAPDTELGGTDDIIASGGSTDGDYTIIEFSRKITSNDEFDLSLVPGSNQAIWSFGSSDDTGKQHVNRGYGEITL